jgi:hypothetical protein
VRGEIGILKDIVPSGIRPLQHFFLIMELNQCEYMGPLLFDDPAFCGQLFALLPPHCGARMQDVGSIDLSGLL